MPPQVLTSSDKPSNDKKGSLKLIADFSKAKPTLLHFCCVALWSGWLCFYVYIPLLAPILWFYCPWLLAIIAFIVLLSAILPAEEKLQPKVTEKFIYLRFVIM